MLFLCSQIGHNVTGYALGKFLVLFQQADNLAFLEPIKFVRNSEKRFDHPERLCRSYVKA